MTAARGRRSPTLDSFIAGCAVIAPCPQAFTLNVRMTALLALASAGAPRELRELITTLTPPQPRR